MKKNINLSDFSFLNLKEMSSTIKAYDDSSYITDHDARLEAILPIEDDFYMLFDSTIFFPEEGGQTCDRGTLTWNGHTLEVIDVYLKKEDSKEFILHRVRGCDVDSDINSSLVNKDKYHMEIDFDHRYSNMQNHTGEHIFSGIVKKEFGYDNVGFHLSDNSVTMDYDGPLTDVDVARIEEEVNFVIAQNFPVYCMYPTREELDGLDYRSKIEIDGPVRIVEIPGIDTCACCAPHVYSTCEVGHLIVLSAISYKGGTRLSILCGDRANKYIKENQNTLFEISHKLKLPFEELTSGVDKLQLDNQSLKQEISSLQAELLKMKLNSIPSSVDNLCINVPTADSRVKRDCINELKQKYPGLIMILDGNESHYSFVLGSSTQNCNAFLASIRDKLDIKGGGKAEMVQGSIDDSIAAIERTLIENDFLII